MSASQPRIVITGLGAVCGAGLTVDGIWQAVNTGKSAVARITSWDVSQWPAQLAAEVVGVDNRTLVEDRKLHKTISRTDLFGLYAAGAAIKDSGLTEYRATLPPESTAGFNDRCGVFAGSGGGSYKSNYEFFPLMTHVAGDMPRFGREVNESVNPMWLLRHLPNNVLCHVGIRHNFKGTNACVTNQCAGGALALTEAAMAIRSGEADRAVAVGHDAPIEPETVFNYHRLGLMSNDAVRPFDAARSGTIFGEGSAAVVLEKEADARARGANILGEFLGSGCCTEATGVVEVSEDGEGLRRAILLALADSGISPADIGMIVAHGNGTRASDASEARALRQIFGSNLPPITAFKWAFGHLIAASGVLDTLVAVRALREGVAPGIATLNQLDAELAPLPVSASPQKPRKDTALICCRGFAGMNVVLVLRAPSAA